MYCRNCGNQMDPDSSAASDVYKRQALAYIIFTLDLPARASRKSYCRCFAELGRFGDLLKEL